jgi:hypothetical protein
LIAELAFQVFDIVVAGVEVPEGTQFFLKCPQGIEVFLPCVPGLEVSILKESVNAWSATIFELAVCDVELFLGELASLGEEQADKDIAGADSFVVLVLQASFGHGVKKVSPANDL